MTFRTPQMYSTSVCEMSIRTLLHAGSTFIKCKNRVSIKNNVSFIKKSSSLSLEYNFSKLTLVGTTGAEYAARC